MFAGEYTAPEFFPVVENNHAKAVKVSRDEIYVDPRRLVKGPCPGVKLDVYFPGFPTLKHIPHEVGTICSCVRYAKEKLRRFYDDNL